MRKPSESPVVWARAAQQPSAIVAQPGRSVAAGSQPIPSLQAHQLQSSQLPPQPHQTDERQTVPQGGSAVRNAPYTSTFGTSLKYFTPPPPAHPQGTMAHFDGKDPGIAPSWDPNVSRHGTTAKKDNAWSSIAQSRHPTAMLPTQSSMPKEPGMSLPNSAQKQDHHPHPTRYRDQIRGSSYSTSTQGYGFEGVSRSSTEEESHHNPPDHHSHKQTLSEKSLAKQKAVFEDADEFTWDESSQSTSLNSTRQHLDPWSSQQTPMGLYNSNNHGDYYDSPYTIQSRPSQQQQSTVIQQPPSPHLQQPPLPPLQRSYYHPTYQYPNSNTALQVPSVGTSLAVQAPPTMIHQLTQASSTNRRHENYGPAQRGTFAQVASSQHVSRGGGGNITPSHIHRDYSRDTQNYGSNRQSGSGSQHGGRPDK